MTLYGWDASDFDHDRGPMDLAAARRAGIDFFTHKYTESTSTRHHPQAAMNAAKAAGVPFLGAYVVPRTPGPSIAAQASYLLDYADQITPWWKDFPGWFWQVDTEHWSYDAVSASTGAAMCAELHRRTGKAVLHYAPKWAYGDKIPGTEPLWASNYVSGSGDFKTLAAKVTDSKWAAYSGRTPAILQYSSSATIGRQPTCDANLFRGSIDDFARMIGGAAPDVASAQLRGDEMYLMLPKGDVYASTPSGPVLLTWAEWTASGFDKNPPPVLHVATPERLAQLCPTGTAGPDIDVDALATKIATGIAGSSANPLTKADIPAVAAAVRAELAAHLEG